MALNHRYTRTSRSTIHSYSDTPELDLSNENQNDSYPPPPKHIPFPDVPQNSEILNEFFMFAFSFLAATLQFLNLYRTVWWLPESYTKHVVVCFIVLYVKLIIFD